MNEKLQSGQDVLDWKLKFIATTTSSTRKVKFHAAKTCRDKKIALVAIDSHTLYNYHYKLKGSVLSCSQRQDKDIPSGSLARFKITIWFTTTHPCHV